MRQRILYVLCAVVASAGAASAQPRPGPVVAQPARPAVSPYLNILRPGNSPGVNYYGIVRPQLEFRNNIGMLQQQQPPLGQSVAAAEPGGAVLPVTGHATTFLNTGGYYSGRASGPTAARPGSGFRRRAGRRHRSGGSGDVRVVPPRRKVRCSARTSGVSGSRKCAGSCLTPPAVDESLVHRPLRPRANRRSTVSIWNRLFGKSESPRPAGRGLRLESLEAREVPAIVFVGGWGASSYQYAFQDSRSAADSVPTDQFALNFTKIEFGTAAPAPASDYLLELDGIKGESSEVSRAEPLPVLMVIANRDFYYQEYGNTRSAPAPASDYLLVLDGVRGESRDDKHKGEIEITSWSLGAVNPAASTARTADDVVVDGRIITAENYDSAASGGGQSRGELVNEFVAEDKYVV